MQKHNHQKNKQQKKETLKSQKLNSYSFAIKNPVQYSLAIAFLWVVVMFIFSIVGFFANNRGYLWNLNSGSIFCLVISILWMLTKIGVGESLFYKFQKHRDKSFGLKYKVNVEKITKEEYRKRREAKSWIGSFVLLGITSTIFLITMIIQLV